jgi:uncharacterized protein YfaS (alpha-2-macroglobulin family)
LGASYFVIFTKYQQNQITKDEMAEMKKQEMLTENGISTGKIQRSAGPCVHAITTVKKHGRYRLRISVKADQ